jgi:hypothetical protein
MTRPIQGVSSDKKVLTPLRIANLESGMIVEYFTQNFSLVRVQINSRPYSLNVPFVGSVL